MATHQKIIEETHSILQRMRELAVQAANDTNTISERQAIQNELHQLREEIDRIGNTTEFNTRKLLNGSGGDGKVTLSLQIGANAGQGMKIEFHDMRSEALGLKGDQNEDGLDVSDHVKAGAVIDRVTKAIERVSSDRSRLGAYQNRLEHTMSNLANTSENLQAAESRIRDVDMARIFMEYTKHSILSQVALAMLAQANQQSQSVLRLLQ
nr:flagellin [Halalkalibacter nanhaiisediminis]